MPVTAARNAGAIGVRFLMACRALKARHAVVIGTSHHVGEMTAARVPLLRIIHRRVAVDAARMDEDGMDLLPGGKSLGAARVIGWTLLSRTVDSAETQKEREHGKTDDHATARHG